MSCILPTRQQLRRGEGGPDPVPHNGCSYANWKDYTADMSNTEPQAAHQQRSPSDGNNNVLPMGPWLIYNKASVGTSLLTVPRRIMSINPSLPEGGADDMVSARRARHQGRHLRGLRFQLDWRSNPSANLPLYYEFEKDKVTKEPSNQGTYCGVQERVRHVPRGLTTDPTQQAQG